MIDVFLAKYFKENLEVSPDLRDWCIKHLDELMEDSEQGEYEIKLSLERALQNKESERHELIRMKTKGLVSIQDFEAMQREIRLEMKSLQESLQKLGHVDTDILDNVRKDFDLVTGITAAIENGGFEEKRDILLETCSNLRLKDKNLDFQGTELFSIISRGLLASKQENPMFEPVNWRATKGKAEVFASVRPTLLRGLDAIRTSLQTNKSSKFALFWLGNLMVQHS